MQSDLLPATKGSEILFKIKDNVLYFGASSEKEKIKPPILILLHCFYFPSEAGPQPTDCFLAFNHVHFDYRM